VWASDAVDAQSNCSDLCTTLDDEYIEEAGNDEDKAWGGFDCTQSQFGPTPAQNPMFECYGGVVQNSATSHGMHATVMVATIDGLSTSYDNLVGTIDIDRPTCASTICPISIRGIAIAHATRSGLVRTDLGISYPYSIENLAIGLEHPAEGLLDTNSGQITFYGPPLAANWSTGLISFDGLGLGVINKQVMTINQVHGSLQSDVLQMNLEHTTEHGSAMIILEASLN